MGIAAKVHCRDGIAMQERLRMRKFEQRNDGGLPRLVPFGHDAGTLFGIVEQLSLRERLQIAEQHLKLNDTRWLSF